MKNQNRSNYLLAWVDILMNLTMRFVALFFLAVIWIVLQQDAKTNDDNLTTKAEMMISMEWAGESPDDVDLWVQDPLNNTVSFRNREIGFLSLDRDSLGKQSNSVTLKDGTVVSVDFNKEIVSLRGIIPGEYIVNVHMYSKRALEETKIRIKIIRIQKGGNLMYREKEVTLKRDGEEKTIMRFKIDQQGTLIDTNDLPKKLVTKQ